MHAHTCTQSVLMQYMYTHTCTHNTCTHTMRAHTHAHTRACTQHTVRTCNSAHTTCAYARDTCTHTARAHAFNTEMGSLLARSFAARFLQFSLHGGPGRLPLSRAGQRPRGLPATPQGRCVSTRCSGRPRPDRASACHPAQPCVSVPAFGFPVAESLHGSADPRGASHLFFPQSQQPEQQ